MAIEQHCDVVVESREGRQLDHQLVRRIVGMGMPTLVERRRGALDADTHDSPRRSTRPSVYSSTVEPGGGHLGLGP